MCQGFLNLIHTYRSRLMRNMEEEVFVLVGEFLSEEESVSRLDNFAKIDRGQGGTTYWAREVWRLE